MAQLKLIQVLIALLIVNVISTYSQDRFKAIEHQLTALSVDIPGLDETIEDIDVSNVSIQTFLRGLAKSNEVNLSIDPAINITLANNFSNVTLAELIMFLVKEYDLDVKFVGNIITMSQYIEPEQEEAPAKPKKLNISYNKSANLITLDLRRDTLYKVTREITRECGKNIILADGLESQVVNLYVQDMAVFNALDKLAFSNKLDFYVSEDSVFTLTKVPVENARKSDIYNKSNTVRNKINSTKSATRSRQSSEFELNIIDKDNIFISAQGVPVSNIIELIAQELKVNYFIYSEIPEIATINLSNVSFEQILNYFLNATQNTWRIENGIYLLGERKLEGFRTIKVYQFQYRTVENILDYIPSDYQLDVELKEFPELNSIILSGSSIGIEEIIRFCKDIDQVVPVVFIEVLIIDTQISHFIETGISAGIGDGSVTTGGKVFPEVDISMNAGSVNKLLQSISGLGLINLGKVKPEFYMTLKAMEDDGIVKIRSTPKLASLNSHEATLSIGSTRYYSETSTTVMGTQNPQNIVSQQYKSLNADLSITIRPVVSGDEQITLEINVDQSDFSEETTDRPPGKVSRSFSSYIRVKNEEMVLLGGLEEKSTNDSGKGVPLLSRVPVLKWFFSSRSSKSRKSRLNIFIKPTIVY